MGLFFRPKKQVQSAAAIERNWYREHPRDAAYFSGLFAQAAPGCRIAFWVPAEILNPDADPDAAPVDFLFFWQSCPVLAVSLVYQDTYRERPFCATKAAVEQAGIPYLRFFADMANEPDYVLSRIQEALSPASGRLWPTERDSRALPLPASRMLRATGAGPDSAIDFPHSR